MSNAAPDLADRPDAAADADAAPQSAATVEMPSQDEYVAMRLCDLKRGTTLQTPILDERGVLLLNAGMVITDTFHAKLVARGLVSVMVHAGEVAKLLAGTPQGEATEAPPTRPGVVAAASNPTSEALDQIAMSGRGLALPPQDNPFRDELADRTGAPLDPDRWEKTIAAIGDAVTEAAAIQREIADGRGVNLTGLTGLADAALDELAEDRDLFVCIALSPHGGNRLTRHGVHAARLGAAVGAVMGLDRSTLRELMIGILVHDAGMLRIDPAVYETPGPLGKAAFLEITKHPVLVFDALKSAREVPARSAFVAYQIHERCDGSGYPRRRTASQMHVLAKVAAVVDSFIALTASRSYRPALAPHHAIRHVLKEAGAGALDAEAVRGLLKAVSLFPLGSRVKLDDGRRGRVVRTTADYSRPLLELDPPGGAAGRGGPPGELLDLSQRREVQVMGVSADAAPLIEQNEPSESLAAAA
ncbi:HD-GYP domain-containing protein [Alienimonas chondri]|uniref:HD-GYP domain-containing protein n=1 Tax=Alienimonas chondri TaxID=2681879 RepID=A0ABX1VGM8_9PLAN|nr:HD domain-containing phosphohydrolase [Alienimonas chondri]NNJ27015.1 hypothetical protein [Alienimonas chondri]